MTHKLMSILNQTPSILFLTIADTNVDDNATKYHFSGQTLPDLLRNQNAIVDIKSWQDPSLDLNPSTTEYTAIIFLWCDNYMPVASQFHQFIKDKLVPLKHEHIHNKHGNRIKIMNDPEMTMWNMDKIYLQELEEVGQFLVPGTTFINILEVSQSTLLAEYITKRTGPLVVKPSISAGGRGTYLIKNCENLSSSDTDFLDSIYANHPFPGSLMLQDYESAIQKGELSLVYINNVFSNAVLKIPASGEFRCQGRYGGVSVQVNEEELPKDAIKIAEQVLSWLRKRFGIQTVDFARIDGIVREEDGRFVLIEAELFEPHMWLDDDRGMDTRLGTDRFVEHMMSVERLA